MNRAGKFKSWLRVGAATLVGVLVLAVLLAGVHQHPGGADEGCAVCALAHAPADFAPQTSAPPDPRLTVVGTVTTPTHAPASAPRVATSSRAPPVG